MARKWNTLELRNQILQMLPTRGTGITVLELTTKLHSLGFDATKKTVQRNLDALAASGVYPIDCNDKAEPYGWRWAEGMAFSQHGMSVAEAIALTLVAKELRRILPKSLLAAIEPQIAYARGKLDAEVRSRRNRVSGWASKVCSVPRHQELVPPKVDPDVLEVIEEAVLAEKQLDLTYQKLGEAMPAERRVEPLAILQRGPTTYVVARPAQGKGPQLYAVHRATKASIVAARVRREGFDLEQFVASQRHIVGANQEVDLVARVDGNLVRILRETPLEPAMTIHDKGDGWFQIQARVTYNTALEQWLLGHGRAIEVLEPRVLREAIRAHATAMNNTYTIASFG